MIRKIIFLVALLVVFANAEEDSIGTPINAETMFPENNASNLFQTRPDEEILTEQPGTFREKEDINGSTTITEIPQSDINTTSVTEFGRKDVSEDMDWGDPAKLDKFFQDNLKNFTTQSSNIAEDMRKKADHKFRDKNGKELDPLKPSEFTQEKIIDNFEDENDAKKALLFKDDLYKNIQAKMVTHGQIQCYITRRLNNSYFCPIPSYGTATFGGGAKDDKDEAKQRCNKYCRVPIKCLPRKNNDSMQYVQGGEYVLPIKDLSFPLNPEQITKEFTFSYMPENINDTQDDYFEKNLVRSRITITGIDPEGNLVNIYEKYVYTIKKDGGRISLRINKKLKNIKLYFYNSYVFDPRAVNEVSLKGDNPQIRISNISAGFLSDSRYFCPYTQFITDAKKCDGFLKSLSFGSGSYSICIPPGDKIDSRRSTIDGGYYSEDSCDAICWEEKECVPTYKHLSQVGPEIPVNSYDIEYGCVEGDNNQGCTQERCKELFEGELEPVKEKVWEKDDEVVETVNSGVETGFAPRPKVDFGGELSTNNGDKENLFIQEMKDATYQYMVNQESFNVTRQKINDIVEEKVAIKTQINDASAQISQKLLYKAKSNLYDSGKKVYLYPIIKINLDHRPINPIRFGRNIFYPDQDLRIRSKYAVYLLATNYNTDTQSQSHTFFPLMRELNTEYYLPITNDDTGVTSYKWLHSDEHKVEYKTYDLDSKKYLPYSLSSYASQEYAYLPESSNVWTEVLLFRSLDYLISMEGVAFVDNSSKSGMIFDQTAPQTTNRAHYYSYDVYLVASETKLTYGQIINKLQSGKDKNYYEEKVDQRGTLVYDSQRPRMSRTEIEPDSVYNDDRVSLYTLGTGDKRTMFMKIKPNTLENGHRSIIFMFLHK